MRISTLSTTADGPLAQTGHLAELYAWCSIHADVLTLFALAALAVGVVARSSWRYQTRKRTVVLAAALTAVTCTSAWHLAQWSGVRARAEMRRPLEGIAPTYSSEMTSRGHWMLPSDAPADDPQYLELIECQKRWLAVNAAVADVYTFRRDGNGRWALIVDSETDYDRNGSFEGDREQRTDIGEPYDQSHEELGRALAGQYVFMDEPETDRWGTWVSAFVPIYSHDGTVEAVLGVDFPAEEWQSAVAAARLRVLVYLGVIALLINGAAWLQTVHQRHMKQLRASADALAEQARRLDVANSKLMIANAEAESANRSKSEFLANMSHEIRTPMTAILGFADILAGENDLALSPSQRADSLNTIRRNGEHLLTIINDILDISKIEAGKMTTEKFAVSPREALNDVRALMEQKASIKGLSLRVEIEPDMPATVMTDPYRLRQIVVNLVGNAIKFTETGSVSVSASFSHSLGRLTVRVADTGIGLTREQQGRLFRSFEQADTSTTRRFGGTGLGLQISRRLAELLGGTLTVESEQGRGSIFTLQVSAPVGATSDQPAPNPTDAVAPLSAVVEPRRRALEGARILLAEDGPDNQRLITFYLARQGASVTVASNGLEALRMLTIDASTTGTLREPAPFDLILTDMQMPEMDGYTLARTLTSMGNRKPVVALTAHAMSCDREKCLGSGCSAYATKPIDKDALIRLCADLISGGTTHSASRPSQTSRG